MTIISIDIKMGCKDTVELLFMLSIIELELFQENIVQQIVIVYEKWVSIHALVRKYGLSESGVRRFLRENK